MLTSRTANPTTESFLRLLGALDMQLEIVLPSGERLALGGDGSRTVHAASTKARRAKAVAASSSKAAESTKKSSTAKPAPAGRRRAVA